MNAYSMVKCEECKHVYRDDKAKCPRCGLERDVFDPPERRKGPGAQFREGEGLAGWAHVYADEPREAVIDRQARILRQLAAGQYPGPGGGRQPWAAMWKRGKYRR
jgi:hypothetical protein